MQFFNFNFYTFLFFLSVIIFLFYLFFRYFKNLNNKKFFNQKKYFYVKYIFLFLSFFTIFLSIFGIKIFSENKKSSTGVDIVFVLDVSKSMNSADIKGKNGNYTRLDFSKKIIGEFVLKNPGNRYSLITFSGESKSNLPLTNDLDLFLTFLENSDYKNFEKQGSDFLGAIKLANSRSLYAEEKNKIIIFISDGGDEEDIISKEISKFKTKNNNYFILGVGSEKGGKIVLGKDVFGNISFQRYNGEDVIVKLNEKNLKEIANYLNGKYFKIEKISDTDSISKKISSFEKKVYLKNFSESFDSFSRFLAFFSFLFFILFLIFYILDFKKYEK